MRKQNFSHALKEYLFHATTFNPCDDDAVSSLHICIHFYLEVHLSHSLKVNLLIQELNWQPSGHKHNSVMLWLPVGMFEQREAVMPILHHFSTYACSIDIYWIALFWKKNENFIRFFHFYSSFQIQYFIIH